MNKRNKLCELAMFKRSSDDKQQETCKKKIEDNNNWATVGSMHKIMSCKLILVDSIIAYGTLAEHVMLLRELNHQLCKHSCFTRSAAIATTAKIFGVHFTTRVNYAHYFASPKKSYSMYRSHVVCLQVWHIQLLFSSLHFRCELFPFEYDVIQFDVIFFKLLICKAFFMRPI